jgi:hypothetical protein
MLNELTDLQESEEEIHQVRLSIDVETRSTDGDELVEKEYTFTYAPSLETWMFFEYTEKRTPDVDYISGRNWRQSRHIFWEDPADTSTIDVPPEVSEKLAEATGCESVTIQLPKGAIDELKYDTFTYEVKDSSS